MRNPSAVLFLLTCLAHVFALREFRSWSTREQCISSQQPYYPFAYEKYPGQITEAKARTNTNLQDFRHECQVFGGQSKCNICEDIACLATKGRCALQLQGVNSKNMSKNVPSVSDTAWPINGNHRKDYGNPNVTHFCVFLSGGKCSQPTNTDFSNCRVRCFGYGIVGAAQVIEPPRRTVIDKYKNIPPGQELVDLWVKPRNCAELKKAGGECTYGGPKASTPSYNPQGFTFTYSGSGQKGLLDGSAKTAEFNLPEDVAVDKYGYIVVADTGNNAIRLIELDGSVKTLAGKGTATSGYIDGACTVATFNGPKGVDVTYEMVNGVETMVIIVADTNNHRIRRLEYVKSTSYCHVSCLSGLCGNNTLSYTENKFRAYPIAGYADGPGSTARYSAPESVAILPNGQIAVADTGNFLIRILQSTSNGTVYLLAGTVTTGQREADGSPLAGCPPPCLVGVQGFRDGNLTNVLFYNPLDLTPGPNNTIYIVDEHRLRMLSLPNIVTSIYDITTQGTIVTLAGNALQGHDDGRGDESTFFEPSGVFVTSDNIAYTSDRASCRVRRVTPLPLVAQELTCSTDAQMLVRPSGCTSFEQVTDKTGLKISRVEANIQYSYGDPWKSNLDWGKRPKNCVGSPPPDVLDKHFVLVQGDNLVVDDHLTMINEDSEAGMAIMVHCPSYCASTSTDPIYGTDWYSDSSSVCLAGIHAGIISNRGGYMQLVLERRAYLWGTNYAMGSTRHGLRSLNISETAVFRVFGLQKYNISTNIVHTVAGTPSAKLESSCHFSDGQPSTLAGLNSPAGLAARPGVAISDIEFLYVADTLNNRIRAISATCTQICENGAKCVGPDKCACRSGWTGVDCTTPICSTVTCGSNTVCVAPNTCACKPGYKGANCNIPQCVQTCENGGVCSQPDTCLCQLGWFDSNCTTPVCSQTCANGGNCTGIDTCSCPKEWTGFDCRTPVCTQTCINGGMCVAPNTCQCPPQWIGHDCSLPVCTQGMFRANPTGDQMKEYLLSPRLGTTSMLFWPTYKPCNLEVWCASTNEFECYQQQMVYNVQQLPSGPFHRKITGRKTPPLRCMNIELPITYKIPYTLILDDGTTTGYVRYSPKNPYLSNSKNPWRGYTTPENNHTGPWTYVADRQIAQVDWLNVSQGVYVCANNGNCTAPDVCQCAKGWIGFDCRTPICTQGYYNASQQDYVSGQQTSTELQHFLPFMGNNKRRLDWPYSNPIYNMSWEVYSTAAYTNRSIIVFGGQRYLGPLANISDSTNPGAFKFAITFQGGYRCSVRAVTKWENASFIFEHPNYYSKYMDQQMQADFKTYTFWKNMMWPPLFNKSRILDQDIDGKNYRYTNEGWRRFGVWSKTNEQWMFGICLMEFNRTCGDKNKQYDIESDQWNAPTQNPDLSYRARISFTDLAIFGPGRWVETTDGECVDQVIRGCYNNGTCVMPDTCACAKGWTGSNCNIPLCQFACKHNGNCTGPDECTCEKGWTGSDCSVPMCAQECQNDGVCIAPDTCKCNQWPNTFRDYRTGGGRPVYQWPNGDPLNTGWTGFDCSTPICTQAEFFSFNRPKYLPDGVTLNNEKNNPNATQFFGGHGGDGLMKCIDAFGNELPRCPTFDVPVTFNDGTCFQTGCGYDPYDTGCCVADGPNNFNCYVCPPGMQVVVNSTYYCSVPFTKTVIPSNQKDNSVAQFLDPNKNFKICGSYHYPRNYPPTDPTQISYGTSVYFVDQLKPRYSSYNYASNFTSNRFLCNIDKWVEGDYIDSITMSGKGDGLETLRGRHVRVNFPNIQSTIVSGEKKFIQGRQVVGEGIYVCFNYGSCLAPDTCTCQDGYSGVDCNTPLCRHLQPSGKVTACLNGGICAKKDTCVCIKSPSQLYAVEATAPRGITGWTGTDCSIPVCVQGFYDPFCTDLPQAPSGEGCYRCANGGNCTAPDFCTCAPGWTGYDCRTPVCEVLADPLTRMQLGTVFEEKVVAFESDPCAMLAMYGKHGYKGRKYTRGNCSLPNICTCFCFESYNVKLCNKYGTNCDGPWQDSMSDFRNLLKARGPNYIFGTQSCYAGHEGNVNEMDQFTTCHLEVYVPTTIDAGSLTYIFVGASLTFAIAIAYQFIRVRLKRMYLLAKIERRRSRRSSEESLLQAS